MRIRIVKHGTIENEDFVVNQRLKKNSEICFRQR